jgi:uncharacterized membrane protein
MTLDHALFAVTFLAVIGCGLIAGVFFAFSTFVMKALAKRPAAEGMAAMQSINVVVINPMFLGVFMGTAALSIAAAVMAMIRWQQPQLSYVLGGAALYVLGTFGVTIMFNVPLNNGLASITPTDPQAAERWADYVKRWTMWNHVRTFAAALAMVWFILALRR